MWQSVFFIFFSDISTISTLDSDQISHQLICIDYKWYEIGLSLKVHRSLLDDLKRNSGCSYYKLKKVIQMWKDTEKSAATWKTVITAIESRIVNEIELANRIRENVKYSKWLLLRDCFINNERASTVNIFILQKI